MYRQLLRNGLSLAVLAGGIFSGQAAVYQETGGQVVVEAEHFHTRTADTEGAAPSNHHWHIYPDDDGTDFLFDYADAFSFSNSARAPEASFIQMLPNGGPGQTTEAALRGGPYVDYKVRIDTPGTYQMLVRWAALSGSDDSIYGWITELGDGVGGAIPDWHRFSRNNTAFGWQASNQGFERLDASGGNPSTWQIDTPGVYTIRLTYREDGPAVDALAFQLSSLPVIAETVEGPAESAQATDYLLFNSQPQGSTIGGGNTITLSASGESGSGTVTYQWQKKGPNDADFTDISEATSSSYTTPVLTGADNPTEYRVMISASGNSLTSNAAVVMVDAESSVLESAGSLTGAVVGLCFSEQLDPTSAENASNYTIAGATITGATLLPHGMSVALDVTGLSSGNFTVTVQNVEDLFGNAVPAGTSANGTVGSDGYTAEDIGDQFDPVEPGMTIACGSGEFDIIAGGSDFWGSTDRGQFLHKTFTGDFDLRMKAESLLARDDSTKVGLMARESMAPGSRALHAIVMPPDRRNIFEAGVRDTLDGSTATWGGNPPASYPNSWIRLRRTDNIFRAYHSDDGENWIQFGIYEPATPFAQALEVGLAATSHNNNPGQTTVAHVSNFGVVADTTAPTIIGVRRLNERSFVLTWDEPVEAASAGLASNYTINNGATVTSATLGADQQSVTIVTQNALTPGTIYTITANNVKDRATPVNTANNVMIDLRAFEVRQGVARADFFHNIGGTAVSALTSAATYIANQPDNVLLLPSLSGPNGYGDNYGTRVTGWITPATSGDYNFFLRSDDASQLFISTDENLENLELVAQETDCCDAFQEQFIPNDDNSTYPTTLTPISMTAGQRYAFMVLQKEGGGGDWWQVAMREANDFSTPADQLQPISGNILSALVDPNVAPTVTISSPASGARFPAGGDVTLTATATDTDGTVSMVEFFANGEKIGESTGPAFSISWQDVPEGRYTVTARATDNFGKSSSSAPVSVVLGDPAEQILYAVGDPAALTPSDAEVIAFLRTFGYEVVIVDDVATTTAGAYGKELIITSSTINSGDVGDKFRNVPIPVVNWEQALQDNYLMTLDDGALRGELTGQTTIDIVDADHPLAAGLAAGPVAAASAPVTFTWGIPNANAEIVATINADPSRAAIYGYDQGAILIDNATPAPARRVHIFSQNDTYAATTPEGKALFKAAFEWALGRELGTTPGGDQPVLDVSRSGNQVTITWTNGGTLYSAPAVDGQWTSTGDSDGSYTTTATEPQSFFQVQK